MESGGCCGGGKNKKASNTSNQHGGLRTNNMKISDPFANSKQPAKAT